MESGFSKANSNNLPRVDAVMLGGLIFASIETFAHRNSAMLKLHIAKESTALAKSKVAFSRFFPWSQCVSTLGPIARLLISIAVYYIGLPSGQIHRGRPVNVRRFTVTKHSPIMACNDLKYLIENCGLCAAAVSLVLGRIGRWSGREIARSTLSLARSAQAERDNESCFFRVAVLCKSPRRHFSNVTSSTPDLFESTPSVHKMASRFYRPSPRLRTGLTLVSNLKQNFRITN
ncbi:hypothetical protein EVAR_20362_1 [Eumeta japonica]|uniref:Uncharacterized protein n=1 Tax=Eumeta variegata TaxID=151549 RepID=A0A4C1VUL8_EUMVA|nr:hypothetical protein EVAR_20362_1 [Eumeta japonica]